MELTKIEKMMIAARVMKIAVLVLFRSHVYTCGGRFFLQKKGGTIGLRSTCAVALLVIQWCYEQWLKLMARSNLYSVAKARYMDDLNAWLYAEMEMDGGRTGLQFQVER